MSGASTARQEIEAFLFHEARLADEHRYDEWEALWTDDALYWVPAEEDADPDGRVSIIYDNRRRIATRIRQLTSGDRYAQSPPSRLRRLISNIELATEGGEEGLDRDGDVEVASNFLVVEVRLGETVLWGGRTEHRLRHLDGELRMVRKKVMLAGCADDHPTLAFLI